MSMGTKNLSSGSQHNPRGVNQGITLVAHETGLPIDSVVDGGGVRRLAVDANVSIQNATINVDLQSDTDNVAIRNTANDNELLIQVDGSITTRIVDETGTAFSNSNPLPVEITDTSIAVELSALGGDSVAVSGHQTQITKENEVSVTTNVSYTAILTFIAAVANSNIAFVEITGPVDALIQIKLNTTIIRKGRIHSGERNVRFPFVEPRRIGVGDTITVLVKPEKPIPAFMATAEFFSSLQGFIDT